MPSTGGEPGGVGVALCAAVAPARATTDHVSEGAAGRATTASPFAPAGAKGPTHNSGKAINASAAGEGALVSDECSMPSDASTLADMRQAWTGVPAVGGAAAAVGAAESGHSLPPFP